MARISKYGAPNTVADLTKNSEWRGVGSSAAGTVTIVGIDPEGTPEAERRITAKGPKRTTRPLISSFLYDYRLVTPGTPWPEIATSAPTPPSATNDDNSIPLRSVSFVALGIHESPNITETMRKSWDNTQGQVVRFGGIEIGHVTHVQSMLSVAGTYVKVTCSIRLPLGYYVTNSKVDVTVHPAENRADLNGINILCVRNGDDARERYDFLPLPALAAPEPVAATKETTTQTAPAASSTDSSSSDEARYMRNEDMRASRVTRILTAYYGSAALRDAEVLVWDTAMDTPATYQMRDMVESARLDRPVVHNGVTVGSVVGLTYDWRETPKVIAHMVLLDSYSGMSLDNVGITTITGPSDSIRPRMVLTHANILRVSKRAEVAETKPPEVLPDQDTPIPHRVTSPLAMALGLSAADEADLDMLTAEASEAVAKYGVKLTPVQYVLGLLNDALAASKVRRVHKPAQPSGGLPLTGTGSLTASG